MKSSQQHIDYDTIGFYPMISISDICCRRSTGRVFGSLAWVASRLRTFEVPVKLGLRLKSTRLGLWCCRYWMKGPPFSFPFVLASESVLRPVPKFYVLFDTKLQGFPFRSSTFGNHLISILFSERLDLARIMVWSLHCHLHPITRRYLLIQTRFYLQEFLKLDKWASVSAF